MHPSKGPQSCPSWVWLRLSCPGGSWLNDGMADENKIDTPLRRHRFVPLPDGERLELAWPTPNRRLWTDPAVFLASTRANPDYGRPGYTRDCGRRFHRGCDITPVRKRPTGRSVTVEFTDCATGREYPSKEPTFVPLDDVFCLFPGRVDECVTNEETSDFGIHVVVRHGWPGSGAPFYTLYGHLARTAVTLDQTVGAGQCLGRMGTTSRVADARLWMGVAPHLHLEVWNETKQAYDPLVFLQAFLPRP